MEKQNNMPKLRFPNFINEWESMKFGELADKNAKWSLTGGPFGSDLKSSDYTQTGIRVIQLQNMGDGLFIDDNKIFTSKSKADKLLSCNIYPNDIILSKMGDPVARACIIPNYHDRYLMCSDGIRLLVDKSLFSNYFVFLSINNDTFRNEALTRSTGSTRKRIGLSELKDIEIYFPSLVEQQKIATFLSTVDEKLQALKKKKSLLETYKKGVMQRLFSQEIRFKDDEGNDFEDWEMKTLGQITKINPKAEKLPNSFIYIDLESVDKGKLNKKERIFLSDAPSRAQRLVKKDDILFQMVRPYQKNNFYFNIDETDYVASTGYAQIRTDEDSNFIYQFLHTDEFVNNVMERCTGTGYPAINSTDLSNIDIEIPCKKEQTKIANFLKAIDEKVNNVDAQIKQTELWKKGLLQQMFV